MSTTNQAGIDEAAAPAGRKWDQRQTSKAWWAQARLRDVINDTKAIAEHSAALDNSEVADAVERVIVAARDAARILNAAVAADRG